MAHSENEQRIIDCAKNNFTKMLREPSGYRLNHKFIVPRSVYSQQLWDWDSWLTDIALCQLNDMEGITDQYEEYEKGCIFNFLDLEDEFGRIPILIHDGMDEFKGFVRYGFTNEASDLANKTIKLFSNDIKNCGELHEYYHPNTGEGVNNPGFQNWNLLSLNIVAWLEGENVISEF